MDRLPNAVTLAIAICLPLSGGILGGMLTASQVKTWSATIVSFVAVPAILADCVTSNWLFGPAWTVLYVCMGIASWFVWKQGGVATQSIPLAWYTVNLVLNFSWTPLFFLMHRPDLALLDIIAMLAVEAVMLLEFAQVIGWKLAGPLLLPYLLWTLYATALNCYIWIHNPSPSSGSLASALLGGREDL